MGTVPTPPTEPATKRAIVFVDGQNLFYCARDAFGYHYPNYDILKLSRRICVSQNWILSQVRFYTGVPDPAEDPARSGFWSAKLAAMGRQGIFVFSRRLRYRNKVVLLPNGTSHSFLHGEEKGIDVRIALDVIGTAVRDQYDVAVVFSQDQDLSEVADEIRVIARQQGRWIRMACAYPVSPTTRNRRGINDTQWIPIDRTMYDSCLDPKDYRPVKK
ncbi:MAG: NYN domain-containing protein [Candidatus Acidiferrales bacterium]